LFFGRCNAPIKYDFRGYFRAILNERAVYDGEIFAHNRCRIENNFVPLPPSRQEAMGRGQAARPLAASHFSPACLLSRQCGQPQSRCGFRAKHNINPINSKPNENV